MLGKIEGKNDNSGGDGWMASLTHWNMSLSKFSEIVKDREVWLSVGLQRVGHHLATEQFNTLRINHSKREKKIIIL